LEKTPVFVVDASVAVKWYAKEEMRDRALRVIDDFVSELIDLQAPSLLLYELGNALRYHPGSTEPDCVDAVKQTRNLGLAIHELDDFLIEMALMLSYREKITFYDAVYLALARSLNATFLTADKELFTHLSERARSAAKLLEEYHQVR
jgi:predicted nucleic acid-binding protein